MRKNTMFGFISRYALVHTLTYIFVGIFFMLVSDYFNYFSENDLLNDIMRPSTDTLVRLSPIIQLFRGTLLAFVIYLFRFPIYKKNGWIKLFALIFIMTSIGAVITGPGSIEGVLYTKIGLVNPLIGYPEVIIQALLVSYFFCRWENKIVNKVDK